LAVILCVGEEAPVFESVPSFKSKLHNFRLEWMKFVLSTVFLFFIFFGRSALLVDDLQCHDWYYILGTDFHNPDSSQECTLYENHVVHDVLRQRPNPYLISNDILLINNFFSSE
jgi:hypothetical protein